MPMQRIFTKARKALRRRLFPTRVRTPARDEHRPCSRDPMFLPPRYSNISSVEQYRTPDEPEISPTSIGARFADGPNEDDVPSQSSDSVTAVLGIGFRGIASIDLTPLQLPTFGGAGSEETLAGEVNVEHTGNEPLQHPAVIERIIQGDVQSHDAIKNNPPPFVRHSAPERHRYGAKKQAEVVETERLQLQEACTLMDAERERLSTRLEQVCQEVADTNDQLERAVHELAVWQDKCRSLRDEHEVLMTRERDAKEAFTVLKHQMGALKEQRDAAEYEHGRRIESLTRYQGRKKRQLKFRILDLEEDLICERGRLRQSELALATYEQSHVKIGELREVEAKLTTANEQLQDKQRQIETLEADREQETKDLQLAQQEVYDMSQKIRTMEASGKQRDAELKASRRTNNDLVLEIRYLKQQVAQAQRYRHTVF